MKSKELLLKHLLLNDCKGYVTSDGRLYKAIIDALEEAINYTHSCTELKDKETPTFDKWLKKWKWKQIGYSYNFKRGESYTDAESLLKSYKKEYYNL